MRKLSLLILFVSLMCIDASGQVSFGKSECLNEGWLFSMSDDISFSNPDFKDDKWRNVNLPHDWSVEFLPSPYLPSCMGYFPAGVAWYRKHIEFSEADLESSLNVYFEGIYNRSEVYLNGKLIGGRPNGYASFVCELSSSARVGDNVISIRVDHSRGADSRWYTGSGIYRNVYLIRSSRTHFSQWGTQYYLSSLDRNIAHIKLAANVENPDPAARYTVKAQLINDIGKTVASVSSSLASDGSADLNMKLRNPRLWDVDDPYLYKLSFTLLENGRIIDCSEVPAGIRSIKFTADKGFFLNGKNIKIKGVCLHHDAGVFGAAVPEAVLCRRLKLLKSIGVNAIRCSHNPQAPLLYDLCDRLGLMVMDEASDEWEFPKRKWLRGWNKGEPGYEGNCDFFEEWIERDVADMVRRDRNHPSVILWSIGNEVDYPNDPYSHPVLDGGNEDFTQPAFGGYQPERPNAERIGLIAARLAECVRSVDRSRPVTGALAGVVMSNQTIYPESVDVVGYNYTESRYDIDHAKYPERIIYGSENRHGYREWKAVEDRAFIAGQFLWTGFDYMGESRQWPSRGLGSGLFDFAGNYKARAMFRESLWADHPVCHLASTSLEEKKMEEPIDVWNYRQGEKVAVSCCSNGAKARLLLNGREVGAMRSRDEKTGMFSWQLEYEPGELKAESYSDDGRLFASAVLRTSAFPCRLVARLDSYDNCNHSAGDIVHVHLEVQDENGIRVSLADSMIKCVVSGGELLGLENGDNNDMSDHRDNMQRAFRGRLLAYVKLGPGQTSIHFEAPLLDSCELVLGD
ncbi:MAG: DUF4982 domain-containing protein [Bacteroidales bacterium]|nr:DUF4982 domain-containing protein [Candidatus Cryptobacteroides equifaecalis]